MLFRRREKPGFKERLRIAVWPRRSWRRSVGYHWKRILRLGESPHAVAAGVAAGVAMATTPFLGLHMVLSVALALLLGGNALAALIATNFGNPFTYPLIWSITFKVGEWLAPGTVRPHLLPPHFHLGRDPFNALMTSGAFDHPWSTLWPLIEPMIVGSLPVAIVIGLVTYVLTRIGVGSYRRRRTARLRARARANAVALPVGAAVLSAAALAAGAAAPPNPTVPEEETRS